jgi:ergothioneine biosynthesis protein EgtB
MSKQTLVTDDRQGLATRLEAARTRTDEIFALLTPAALYERPIAERHRLVFYLGHVEAFDWNLVARQGCGVDSFHPDFDRLFAFGIDPTDGGLPDEPASQWPARAEIDAYNRRVRDRVDECVTGKRQVRPEYDGATLFHMAIEHRLMHAETLAYLLHRLPADWKVPPVTAAMPAPPAPATPRMVAIPAGRATLGRRRSDRGFGWDNEFEANVVEVPAFSIESHKVTNRRFLEFLGDGGYGNRSLWSDRDWEWRESERLNHPRFWLERDGRWLHRGMFESVPLPLDSPVYVSHAEAAAFARWSARTLPTEAQFHRAAYGTPRGDENEYPWGSAAPAAEHGNFDFRHWDPTPVGAHPAGDSAFGVSELVGNGWEWTSSRFEPFPGFAPHPLYAGYSANFFDGDHYVLKGGSPRTAACMLRRSFRNWFQPRYPNVYSTFRLVGS